MLNNTIAALATPLGGSIAVIRISGHSAKKMLCAVFKPKNGKILPRKLIYGHAFLDGEVVDEVMAVYMPSPGTYTREPMAEIHCHGSAATARDVLRALIGAGVSPAPPGEFTKRAFLNGRIDLSQAEAVMDIIYAQARAQSRAALFQLDGGLSRAIEAFEEKLTSMLAAIEAAIDFPDEVSQEDTADNVREKAFDIANELESACNEKLGRLLREGLNVVIVGKPNVGKSSLLNALLQKDMAIVTDIPGTTRDVLTAPLNVGGLAVNITDTAGLHDSADPVEKIGVSRAKDALYGADILLFVLDLSSGFSPEDKDVFDHVKAAGVPYIVVANKSDLPQNPDVLSANYDEDYIELSAMTGDGLSDLREAFLKIAGNFSFEGALTRERHIDAALRAACSLKSAAEVLPERPLDCAAIDIRDALHALGEITGKAVDEDVLDRIFLDFCVGK